MDYQTFNTAKRALEEIERQKIKINKVVELWEKAKEAKVRRIFTLADHSIEIEVTHEEALSFLTLLLEKEKKRLDILKTNFDNL